MIKMEIDELNDFAEWESKRKEKLFGKTNEEMKLIDAVKLSEEVGEFMNELCKSMGLQRKEKLEDPEKTKKELAKEFADVVLTAVILAKRLNIDISDALEEKIEIVRARRYD